MKKLIISIKTSNDSLSDFSRALKKARKGKLKEDHFELSFDNKKDFDRFVKNIGILSAILVYKPKSVYELANIIKMDISNLNKIIIFFEDLGAIKIKSETISGRRVKKPVVEYDHIEFDLRAA